MRNLTLRTQLVFVIVFVWLYSLGVGLSYWIQAQAHSRLEESFHRELAVLAQLPRLRDRLRQLDLVTDNYLLTGNALWIDKRRETLVDIRGMERDLSGLFSEGREREVSRNIERELASYLAQQGQWISRKEAGRLSMADAAKIVGRQRIFDRITELLITMKDVNVEALERQRLAARRASLWTLVLILGTGLAAGGFIAMFLSRYLVGPVSALQRYARGWRLGLEWDLGYPPPSPEMAELFGCLRDMAGRLNLQYNQEHELANLKSRLVSMVSHEFNNALSAIDGVSMLLKDTEGRGRPEKRETYYTILKSNIRALSLASSNILNMGRLESGKFALNLRRAEIDGILKEALARLEILHERKELRVSLEVPEEAVAVRADPEALALVATNLVSNAIKYTPERGEIKIGLRTDPGLPEEVWVYVQDTGIGISREDQEKILAGYYRTESGRKAAKGFGVGLALANSIVEAHGSALKVESEPGKGSCFSFKLPLWKDSESGKG